MQIVKKTAEDWSEQNIADFWNWQSGNSSRQEGYFTAMVGVGIVRFMKQQHLVKGKILDYGCGAGHMLSLLSQQPNVELYGLDFSPDSIEQTKQRVKNPLVLKELYVVDKLPSAFKSEIFDTITFIETIEHLQNKMLENTLVEIHRLLKPGGRLLLTTPFDEELEKHMTFCPFCKAEFHHMQHMQRFTIESLSILLKKHGFKIEFCKNINLEKYQTGSFKFNLKRLLSNMAISLRQRQKSKVHNKPHLVAIVSK